MMIYVSVLVLEYDRLHVEVMVHPLGVDCSGHAGLFRLDEKTNQSFEFVKLLPMWGQMWAKCFADMEGFLAA